MKSFLAVLSMAAFTLLSPLVSHAIPLSGDSTITFGGTLPVGTPLGTITALTFNPFTLVTSVTGDLDSTIDPGNVATFQNFTFNPFVANNPLWSVGGFAFDLSSIFISTQNAVSLVLLGSGLISGNAYDSTPFAFSFSADSVRGVTAFSATNAAVPEPASIILLGSGLALLAVSKLLKRPVV